MIGRSKLGRRVRKGLIVLASVLALGAATAWASGYATPISGTCYSDGSWFTSTNVRTVHSGNSLIKVLFSQSPGGGIAFYALNHNSGVRIGSIAYGPPDNQWMTLGSAAAGTEFVNVFKEVNSHHKPYSWTGSEYY